MDSLEEYRLYGDILCIDLKNFFASVECAERNLDPFKTALVVADKHRSSHSIVLAISPYLKAQGLPSRFRISKLPRKYNAIIAQPRMAKYVEYSYRVLNVYLKYVAFEDMYVYSIDEVFLDVSQYKKLYNMNAKQIARMIMDDIVKSVGIHSACGIGPNMVLAKFALDIQAKKMPDSIAEWNYDNLSDTLWQVKKLSDVWSIGAQTEKKLHLMGIYSMYDLAHFDVNVLRKHMGIRGEELFLHANGIDISRVQDKHLLFSQAKSYSINQTVFKLVGFDDVLVILFEQAQKLASRLRKHKSVCLGVGIQIRCSYQLAQPLIVRRQRLACPTSNEHVIYRTLKELFLQSGNDAFTYRAIGCVVYDLQDLQHIQLSLFEQGLEKEHELQLVLDKIKQKYGENSAFYASALKDNATILERNKLLGGHNAE